MEVKIRKRKIVLVGTGFVGMSFAYSLLSEKGINELVLIDMNKDKAIGEQMDLSDGLPYADSKMTIKAGDYEECADADIVVITAGAAQKPGQTRLELVGINARITKDVATQVRMSGFSGILVVASNPVDIMTYVAYRASGLPKEQVIGSGTILDTARLRYGLSEHYDIAQKNIHAYVFGEHGDTSFVPWSCADVSGAPLDDYAELMKKQGKTFETLDKDAMTEYVHKSGGQIISRKGATFYAVSASVCQLCATLMASSDSVMTVSSMLHGEYGIEDVCVSVLTLVGPNGVQGRLEVKLTDEEIAKLKASADSLKEVISSIEI